MQSPRSKRGDARGRVRGRTQRAAAPGADRHPRRLWEAASGLPLATLQGHTAQWPCKGSDLATIVHKSRGAPL
jgi:hypothetical protein